ncbi:MAG: hypothetical protein NTX82_04375 [Candidatus Parcubacteria bacterium]|nr:hypothetical protein [Candidatus Parcubacteria bacterium]
MQEIIDKIAEEALILFPAEEYGFGGLLSHPGIKIGLVSYDWKLHLMSDIPRTLKKGRYYPCWDCGELAIWFCTRLEQQGIESGVLEIKHDTPDFKAMAHHFHWVPAWQGDDGLAIFDITPGSDLDFCRENKLITDFDAAWWREFLASREYINFVASETMTLINWQSFHEGELKQGFLNYFGIFQRDEALIFQFETIFVHRGIVVDKRVTNYKVYQDCMWKMQKEFGKNPLRSLERLEPYPGTFEHKVFKHLVPEAVYGEALAAVHQKAQGEILPKVFSIFDKKLLRRWANPNHLSWFDRVFG